MLKDIKERWRHQSHVDESCLQVLVALFLTTSLKNGLIDGTAGACPYFIVANAAAMLLHALGVYAKTELWVAYQKAVVCCMMSHERRASGKVLFRGEKFNDELKDAYWTRYKVRTGMCSAVLRR